MVCGVLTRKGVAFPTTSGYRLTSCEVNMEPLGVAPVLSGVYFIDHAYNIFSEMIDYYQITCFKRHCTSCCLSALRRIRQQRYSRKSGRPDLNRPQGLGRPMCHQQHFYRTRKERDSNPRYRRYNTLAGCRFRPLSHLSTCAWWGLNPQPGHHGPRSTN